MCNSPFYFLIIRINIPLHRFGGSHGLHLQLRFAVVGVLALIEGAGHGDPCVRGKSVGLRPLADEAARCKVGGTAGHNQPRGNELVCVHLTAGFIHLARHSQDAGKENIPIVSTGGSPDGFKMLQDGIEAANMTAPVSIQGVKTFMNLYNKVALGEDPAEKFTALPVIPVSADDTSSYIAWDDYAAAYKYLGENK